MSLSLARADLEALLRARKLDRAVARPEEAGAPGRSPLQDWVVPTGIALLDERLGGGLPRGQISEIVGARSSGRLSLACAALAAATGRGELAALVDTLDMFDPESAASCGVTLERLLWIRTHLLDHALKAFNLVLQAGGFDLVVLDLAEVPPDATGRLPFATWLRLQRVIEGSRTVGLLLGAGPIARSAGGVSIQLSRAARLRPSGFGEAGSRASGEWSPRLFLGLALEARIVSARARETGTCHIGLRAQGSRLMGPHT
jgi:recombination protein RecA